MMLQSTPPALPVNALNELKDYLRISLPNEDAKLYGLIRASLDICATFIGSPPLMQNFTEEMPIAKGWQNLSKSPVISIESVVGLSANGAAIVLPVDSYAIDINAGAVGRVHIIKAHDAQRIKVIYSAGYSEDWDMLSDQLRSGIIRLAAHIYSNRDLDAQPPLAITALWQPYRRMRLI